MSEIQVNGVRLYYEQHGDGQPILCIHGLGSSSLLWTDAAPRLAQHGRVITYDRRGCTRSERPVPYERISVAEHADDAAALLEALDAAPAIVIGRSYGGEVALDLAIRRPDLVRGLALLEGAPMSLTPDGDAWIRAFRDRVLAIGDPAAMGATVIEASLGPGAWEALPEAYREMWTENGPAILAEVRAGFLNPDLAALAALNVPTLVVAATDSVASFRETSHAVARMLPDAREHLVDGGHLIDPADPAVLTFLEESAAESTAW